MFIISERKKIYFIIGQDFENPFTNKKIKHKGIDIKAPVGASVYSASDAIVYETGRNEAKGNYIVLIHNETYQAHYSHLEKTIVEKNQNIRGGSVIGYAGNTGYSTGPHLHYEVKENGINVNPEDYFSW